MTKADEKEAALNSLARMLREKKAMHFALILINAESKIGLGMALPEGKDRQLTAIMDLTEDVLNLLKRSSDD